MSAAISGTMLSPAAPANPWRHRAAKRLWKSLAVAHQTRVPACRAMEKSNEARLPNLWASGTQNIFPTLRKRKLN